MPSSLNLLLLDTEMPERNALALALRAAGYPVREARSEQEACSVAPSAAPAAIVLGGAMTATAALRLLQRLRARGWRQPMIVRGDAASTDECVAALTAGADDFVGRDREPREVIARLQAVLRRVRPAGTVGRPLRFGRVIVDLARLESSVDGKPLALTQTEFSLLALLARAEGKPVPRATMLGEIWGRADGTRTRTIETHIWRLRKKIGDDGAEPRWILNHAGVGYSLAARRDPAP